VQNSFSLMGRAEPIGGLGGVSLRDFRLDRTRKVGICEAIIGLTKRANAICYFSGTAIGRALVSALACSAPITSSPYRLSAARFWAGSASEKSWMPWQ
jgi:hypothetical protein